MFSAALNIFKIPELRKKIIFTVAMLCIYRIGFHVPVPGVDQKELAAQTQPSDSDSPFGRVADESGSIAGGEYYRGGEEPSV